MKLRLSVFSGKWSRFLPQQEREREEKQKDNGRVRQGETAATAEEQKEEEKAASSVVLPHSKLYWHKDRLLPLRSSVPLVRFFLRFLRGAQISVAFLLDTDTRTRLQPNLFCHRTNTHTHT